MDKIRFLFIAVIAIAVLFSTSGLCAAQPASNAEINANVMASMKSNFVGKVSFNGALITDIEAVAQCQTKVETAISSTVLDWTVVENPSPEVSATTFLVPIVTLNTTYTFAAPNSLTAQDLDRHMEMAIGLLYLNCRPIDH